MSQNKTAKNTNKFQVAVDYLTEYSGVKGAVIVDPEGLVICKSGQPDFDAETSAAAALLFKSTLDRVLPMLTPPGIEYLTLKTHSDWLTLAQSASLILFVMADRRVDDLLNIRISRSLEMISAHIKEKYPFYLSKATSPARESAKTMEEMHV
jgi:predicted regulator of Ras-like GTPase activity (Roadblock/LC7/MglB family)